MCSDAPAPDPLIGESAKLNAEIAKEALDWYKQKYEEGKPRQAQMDALTAELANQQLETSRFTTQQAKEQYDRYKQVGVPAEDAMYKDASEYDSDVNVEAAAAEAGADVEKNMAQARAQSTRSMARMGVNPNSGRFQGSADAMNVTGALGEAAAENSARKSRRDMGVMLRKDAANFARGMPSTAAQTYGVASQAGAGATGALTAAASMQNANVQTAGAGFNTAIQGNNSAGSIMNQQYAGQLQASNNSGLLSGIGGIAQGLGAMGVTFSDKNMKEDVKPVSGKKALAGVKGVDVKQWKYKPDSPADDGGQEHVGAMAQDMNKHMGEQVAPGGKMVDIISALGVNMAATKELAKQVNEIKEKVHG
jgi:hypothetical protein